MNTKTETKNRGQCHHPYTGNKPYSGQCVFRPTKFQVFDVGQVKAGGLAGYSATRTLRDGSGTTAGEYMARCVEAPSVSCHELSADAGEFFTDAEDSVAGWFGENQVLVKSSCYACCLQYIYHKTKRGKTMGAYHNARQSGGRACSARRGRRWSSRQPETRASL